MAVVGGRRGFKGVVSSSAISRSGRLTCRIQAAVQRVGGGPRRQGEPPGVGRSKATLRLGPGGSWPARRPSVKCGGSVGSGAVSDRGSRGGGRRVCPDPGEPRVRRSSRPSSRSRTTGTGTRRRVGRTTAPGFGSGRRGSPGRGLRGAPDQGTGEARRSGCRPGVRRDRSGAAALAAVLATQPATGRAAPAPGTGRHAGRLRAAGSDHREGVTAAIGPGSSAPTPAPPGRRGWSPAQRAAQGLAAPGGGRAQPRRL